MSPDPDRRVLVSPRAYPTVAAHAPDGVVVEPLDGGAEPAQADFLIPPAGDRTILDVLPGLERLEVVQVLSAGTDWIEGHLPPRVTLCSARGARDGPVAEWVVAAVLGATSGLLACARERRWHSRHLTDLARMRVLIVGMGSIGRVSAERLRGLGAEVVGVASRAREDVHGVDELPALLPDADVLVLLTPLTDATRGLIDAGALARLRDGALVVNAARGPVLDTAALLAETESGRLSAVLDVTDPEPLPDDHPLWRAPGVLAITPHIAGDSAAGHDHAAQLAADQVRRWATGEPLHNVVRAGRR